MIHDARLFLYILYSISCILYLLVICICFVFRALDFKFPHSLCALWLKISFIRNWSHKKKFSLCFPGYMGGSWWSGVH